MVKNDHPTLPISIYNYSRTCQYENKWDEITKMCRGLILDQEGNVIAKGFNKFFNMEEHQPEEIPNEPFEVFEKLDGSLGILFWYQGKWILATKGSFTSDQSITYFTRGCVSDHLFHWLDSTKQVNVLIILT